MSIVPLLSNASARAAVGAGDVWLICLLAASLAVAALARVVPPRGAGGPDRIPPDRPAWLLLGVMFGAMGVYLFSTSLYLSVKYPPTATAAPAPTTQPRELTASDNAFLSTVPPLLGFLALLIGDASIRPRIGQDLGIGLRGAGAGIARGLVGVVIVVPPLFVFEEIVEVVFHRIHYQHPTEHPLLRQLREKPSPGVVVAIVIGACVAAPLFEELLFRGHLQTLIRRMLYRLSNGPRPSAPPRGFAVIIAATGGTLEVPPDPPVPRPPPSAPQAWAAIIVTSLIFASVHPLWSTPVIFLLAVCLGYAYERTGNLWVPITIHAAFNTISTVVFLGTLHGG